MNRNCPPLSASRRSVLSAAAAVLLLLAADAARAADSDREKDVRRTFLMLDTDGDQKVTFEEFQSKKILAFTARDRNDDNYLDKSEVRLTDQQFAAIDEDGDGKISGVEFIDSPYGQFQAYDLDKNGSIDLHELTETLAGA